VKKITSTPGNFFSMRAVSPDNCSLKAKTGVMAMLTRLRKAALFAAVVFGLFGAQVAFACGGLVAPDGDVRLARATTLVDWHNGIEHYMTAFSYQGNEAGVGWIVPLPAVPDSIQAGGRWTFQRLNLAVNPPPPNAGFATAAPTASGATVLQQVVIEALNITVIPGSGVQILDSATQNGFNVQGDTEALLLKYAKGSPIFMAAKYDTSAAKARGQQTGDGVPLVITMKTAHPWVPLEVLALDSQVQADLYFLTDEPLNISDFAAVVGSSPVGQEVPGATGLRVAYQDRLSPSLYHDLSSDRNMSWVRPDSWLTYLSLDAAPEQVGYDLGISTDGIIRLAPFGTPPMEVVDKAPAQDPPTWVPRLPVGTAQVALVVAVFLVLGLLFFWVLRGRKRPAKA
jgi:hypothetical protein